MHLLEQKLRVSLSWNDRDNAAALTLSGLDASIGSDTLADLFKVDLQDARAGGEITVSISVVREGGIDYETYAAYRGELENIILSIADTGQYTKTAPNGLPLPLSVRKSPELLRPQP